MSPLECEAPGDATEVDQAEVHDAAIPQSGVEAFDTDLLIVGGTESGWAAAIQAARLGVASITIVHDGQWLGGQYTEQALACVDENKGVGKVGWGVDWHPMKRSFHRSGLFKELMDRIEAFNEQMYGSPMPGRPYHGPSTFRPVEAEAIFRQMLKPYRETGQVRFVADRYPVRADVDHHGTRPRLKGLWFAPLDGETADLHVRAKLTIDASDWGDAIQLSGAAFECGPDPQSRYGEPSAPTDLSHNPPNEMNPITWAMIVVEAKQPEPISRPGRFDDRNYPRATHVSLAEFRDLKWDQKDPGLGAIPHWPPAGRASPRQLSVHNVRRLVDGYTSTSGQTIILLNYMNGQDYPLERLPRPVAQQLEATESGASRKNIVEMTRRQRAIVFDDARQHALGVLYHLQNFVHRRADDPTHSFRNFVLSEEFGTPDRLPPKPYIREALRLKALYMMREQDGRNRDGFTKDAARERFAAVMYPDGVFAWQFHYDFHRTGRTYLGDEGDAGPWIDFHKPNRHTRFVSDRSVFPLRSLVPEAVDGLLGAQKNVGYSSIVSAAIRLHDQCIAIGQASGAAAAICLRRKIQPREIPFDPDHLEAVRHALCGEVSDGTPVLLWPFRDLRPEDPAFVAVNRLAALGVLPLEDEEVDFRPGAPLDEPWRQEVIERTREVKQFEDLETEQALLATSESTRGVFCQRWWDAIRDLPNRPRVRESPLDADLDRIPDRDDPLPFTPGRAVAFRIEVPPQQDGIPPAAQGENMRPFNFCAAGTRTPKGFIDDHGARFDTQRGFGWSRDLTDNHRRRHALKEVARDTFLFTRQRDQWECAVEKGRYRVTVCVGDSAHEQISQKVAVEGSTLIDNVTTPAGRFREATLDVDVRDGRLTVDLGSGAPGSNTCINWLLLERAP
jgi:hypothetical protein